MTLRRRLLLTLLLAGALVMLLPLAWLVSSSLKPENRLFTSPPEWLPAEPRFENYVEALTHFHFLRYFANTLVIVAFTIFGTLFSCSACGYAFARLRFPGRDLLFGLLLSTMMLPPIVTQIPMFTIFKRLGWIDTWLPLIVPMFFGNPFYIFLFRQFFKTIPQDLFDAARIDGCSEPRLFLEIMLPIARPAAAAVVLFSFLGAWNDFIHPLIYLYDPDRFTLALGLANFRGVYITRWHLLMAASTVMILPVILLFFVGQRHFTKGILMTGVKG